MRRGRQSPATAQRVSPSTWLSILVLLTSSWAMAGCGIPVGAAPTPIPHSAVPFHLLSPRTTPTTRPSTLQVGARELIFLVNTDQHVIGVVRDVTPPANLTEVLGALLYGPTSAEASAGLQSFLTDQPGDVAASFAGGIATVDFTTNPFQIVGPDQTLAVAQVVFTAIAQAGVTGVRFEIDHKPISVPTPAGAQVSGTVNDSTYAAVAPTSATSPTTSVP